MLSLAGFPYVPRHGVAATGDWKSVVMLLVVMAIAFGVMLWIGNRTATKPKPLRKHEPDDNFKKAA